MAYLAWDQKPLPGAAEVWGQLGRRRVLPVPLQALGRATLFRLPTSRIQQLCIVCMYVF